MTTPKKQTQSLFSANLKKQEELESKLKKSIAIKKEEKPALQEPTPKKAKKEIVSRTKKSKTRLPDARQGNARPSTTQEEGFYSIASMQTRVSPYLKVLMKLVDDLELIQPNPESIVGTSKWNYNSDHTVPHIAVSFNGLMIQLIENYIDSKSKREQELFVNALKKEISKRNY